MSKTSRTGEKLVDSMRKNKAAAAQDFPVRALARQGLELKQYCIGTADRRGL